ncbi:unnamed protein product [Arabis nemorensis]|uniref:Uncharacterized protein n=1 Tax=Arabis nemorensis TaxID=586526 RepID=A0A565BG24_9BRAS|nr:unnamed protein product [Arabis nemorensis]
MVDVAFWRSLASRCAFSQGEHSLADLTQKYECDVSKRCLDLHEIYCYVSLHLASLIYEVGMMLADTQQPAS